MEKEKKEEKEVDKGVKNKKPLVKRKKKPMAFGMGILLLVVIAVGCYFAWDYKETENAKKVQASTEAFIQENLVAPGTDLEVASFVEESGMYKMSLSVGGQNVDAYITKDGAKLFPQAIDLTKTDSEDGSTAPTSAPVSEVTNKQDVPVVELFVMSYCPYGTQMEKGILSVAETLGSKIKFDVKFVSYVMHGEDEFKENIYQYCVQKEEPAKFLGYLGCFNTDGDSEKCATSNKINTAKIASCIEATDTEFSLTKDFDSAPKGSSYPPFNIHKDLNVKYGVEGSPTLVVNGETVASGRDSASILKTICSGFTNAPEECQAELSSVAPTPGFGDGEAPATATSDASCQ